MDNNEQIKSQVREVLLLKLNEYQRVMAYMAADAPISILCLPKRVETTLSKSGCLRIYDLFNRDFTKIKGLGKVGMKILTEKLEIFFSML